MAARSYKQRLPQSKEAALQGWAPAVAVNSPCSGQQLYCAMLMLRARESLELLAPQPLPLAPQPKSHSTSALPKRMSLSYSAASCTSLP